MNRYGKKKDTRLIISSDDGYTRRYYYSRHHTTHNYGLDVNRFVIYRLRYIYLSSFNNPRMRSRRRRLDDF